MDKSCSYSTVKMNKSKILCVTIFFHFFISTMLYTAFGTELHDAIDEENKQAVQRLIAAEKVDINSKNNKEMTPLYLAVEKGNSEIVQFLLEAGADVMARNEYYYHNTPLHLAAKRGIIEIVKLLIAYGADVMAQNKYNDTPLHFAAECADVATMKLLIESGADVMARNKNNSTPLHVAALFRNVEIVRLLIESEADVMAQNKYNDTPLHVAALRGTIEIVKLLIASGADVMAQNRDNDTPLHVAAQYATLEIVKTLIASGADVMTENEDYNTPLHVAASFKNVEIVRLLIESGADVMARHYFDSTPLHFAAECADVATIKLLIESGADVMARTKDNNTPLHFAVNRERPEEILDIEDKIDVISLLVAFGADVKAVNDDENTVLDLALGAVLEAILPSTRRSWDGANQLPHLINIFIELLLWSWYQTYASPLSDQQTDFFEKISNLDLNVLSPDNPLFNQTTVLPQTRILLNQSKNLVKWIMAELLKCESKEEFFQKIFDYLLNSYPEEEQNLLRQNIQHLILKEHQANLYPQENTLSESQRQKLVAFKNLLRRTYAKKLKKEIFHHLSEEELKIKLNDLYTLKEISTAIQKYCQNTLIKLPFLQIVLEKYQFNQTAAIRDLVVWSSASELSASEAHSKIFQQHFKNIKSLVHDLYMHLKYIIDQPPGSDRLDSDTQFGRGDNPQDILTFGE